MATNSNYNGGNGQRPSGSGRKPSGSAQRPTGQRPAGSGQRPAGSGQRTGAANGQKRMSAKQRAAKKRKKVIIFGIEIVVILFMVALLYLVMTHTSNEGPKVTVLETEELQIPEEVQQDETMKGYMNIAMTDREKLISRMIIYKIMIKAARPMVFACRMLYISCLRRTVRFGEYTLHR